MSELCSTNNVSTNGNTNGNTSQICSHLTFTHFAEENRKMLTRLFTCNERVWLYKVLYKVFLILVN